MRIVILCEGHTEVALRDGLISFVRERVRGSRIGISTIRLGGSIINDKLARLVAHYSARLDVLGIIALTDVYPEFKSPTEAKARIDRQLKDIELGGRFRAHVAKHDIEAWLIPFWEPICKSLNVTRQRPGAKPEDIDDGKPPSMHFKDLFSYAGDSYRKVYEVRKWLTADRLAVAAQSCPELKLFLNSILEFAGSTERL